MFNLFLTTYVVVMILLVVYDVFSVKPRVVESNRLLIEALDRRVASDKMLDASLSNAMKFLEDRNISE